MVQSLKHPLHLWGDSGKMIPLGGSYHYDITESTKRRRAECEREVLCLCLTFRGGWTALVLEEESEKYCRVGMAGFIRGISHKPEVRDH